MFGKTPYGGVFPLTFLIAILAVPVDAAVFQPVIDEFWIVKNGNEIFRDSFDDGVAPPSGPDGATTYATGGSDAAFTGGEAGGKLTITPSLGTPAAITGSVADTVGSAVRRFSTNPLSSNFLGYGDSFAISGLFDLSSLPSVVGQTFGIRATDRITNIGNLGNNVAQVRVRKSGTTGEIGVQLLKVDFESDSGESADFISIDDILGTANQIELSISKEADSADIAARFIVYDALMNVLRMADLDTTLNISLTPIQLYDGEDYIRAQFITTDVVSTVPLPGAFPLLLVALSTLGLLGWYRTRAV